MISLSEGRQRSLSFGRVFSASVLGVPIFLSIRRKDSVLAVHDDSHRRSPVLKSVLRDFHVVLLNDIRKFHVASAHFDRFLRFHCFFRARKADW